MNFSNLLNESKKHFPKLKIKFKDQSPFMTFLRIILFFNIKFMRFTTTIGHTIYFPDKEYIKKDSACITLMHELVHLYDMDRVGFFLFAFLYLFPQILAVLFLPILFFSWKIALIGLLLLLPWPAYFRMNYERRAYFVSLYTMKKIEEIDGVNYLLDVNKDVFIKQFTGANYYFMWFFPNLKKDFIEAVRIIEDGNRPYQDKIFDIVDDILKSSVKL